jgi:hypothetical protein
MKATCIQVLFFLFLTQSIVGCKKELGFSHCAMFNDFFPKTAKAGDAVTIKGIRLQLTIAIKFNGADADSFKLINDSTIIAYPSIHTPFKPPTSSSSGDITVVSEKCSAGRGDFIFYK